ncbi:MAG: hypothetical protein FD149_1733 [Rhodospirillaceae bacterium]|nr:MAG: hypothetical protein FD149_1733 [Rhodospirillaceae bacterium]
MLFAIDCLDKPDHQSLRLAHRPAHVAYMMGFRDKMVLLGPLLTADGTGMVGSLIVMDLPDRAAVETFLAHDPYGQAGLFESVMVRPFKKVLPEA